MDLLEKIQNRITYLKKEERKALDEIDNLPASTMERSVTWELIRELYNRRRELEEIIKP